MHEICPTTILRKMQLGLVFIYLSQTNDYRHHRPSNLERDRGFESVSLRHDNLSIPRDLWPCRQDSLEARARSTAKSANSPRSPSGCRIASRLPSRVNINLDCRWHFVTRFARADGRGRLLARMDGRGRRKSAGACAIENATAGHRRARTSRAPGCQPSLARHSRRLFGPMVETKRSDARSYNVSRSKILRL